MLDLLPGQCVLVAGSRGSYLFSTDVWIDGMYFKQVHEGDSDPIGGAMNILSKAWITDSTFDWGEPNTASCTQCTVWEDGGFFVEGQVYMKGVSVTLAFQAALANLCHETMAKRIRTTKPHIAQYRSLCIGSS